MSDHLPSAQEPRRLRTRSALLAAGVDLLADRGIDALSVNEIVEAAAVAKGSFFNHFADKEAFAAEVAAEIRADVESRVESANRQEADPARRMARAISVFVQFAVTDKRRARIMLRSRAWIAAKTNPLNAGIRADIDAGIAAGQFVPAAREAGLIYVIGICAGLMDAAAVGRVGRERLRELAGDTLGLTLAGLGVERLQAENIAAQIVREIMGV